MGFDLSALRGAVDAHGRVARVVVAAVQGSSPREVGAAMLVWKDGQSGTIGGGALEFQLAQIALRTARTRLSKHALGPELGQCCGGAVQIVTEVFDRNTLPEPQSGLIVRSVNGSEHMPLKVKKILSDARGAGDIPLPQLCQGWMIEPVQTPSRALWIWGAGHVGRALVQTLAPLPEFAITWVDTSADRFPETIPDTVTSMPTSQPARLAKHAPIDAEHLILTYSHALDLELCHQLLSHNFAFAGLIGSKSKWARFRNLLSALGHSDAQIASIICPIGNPSLGKHPQAIAIGVSTSLLVNAQTITQAQRTFA